MSIYTMEHDLSNGIHPYVSRHCQVAKDVNISKYVIYLVGGGFNPIEKHWSL